MLSTAELIDMALIRFCEDAFSDGVGPSTGETLLAAWVANFPQYRCSDFPYTLRALRGWRRLRPSAGRHPLPYAVVCGLAAYVAHHVSCSMAVALLLCFDGYLRPYELLLIRACDVYPPTVEFTHYSIQICPWQVGRPSKTRIFDDTIRLDSAGRPEISELVGILLKLHAKAGKSPDQRLFDFTHSDMAGAFKAGLEWLHLSQWDFVPYCLRHGGPSADRADHSRTVEQVQRRGRWASEKSLRRYEQTGRLHAVIASLPAPTLYFCRRSQAHVLNLVLFPRGLKRPEVVIHHVPFAAPFPAGD